jgi:hypothetical protein
MNAMGKAIGFQDGDILLKINGDTIPDLGPEFGPFIQGHMLGLQEGKTLSYTVMRKDANGENKEVVLSAPVVKIDLTRRHDLQPSPNATPEQMALREAWLRP